MGDNIQFRVDAVLGDTTQLQQQIQSLKTNLSLTINNTQALQSVKQVQQQINALQQSMNSMNFNFGGSGGSGSSNSGSGSGGTVGHPLIANQQFQTTTQSAHNVQSVINSLNTQIEGTVSKLRLCTDETGKIIGGTAEIAQGATVWTRNIEQARDANGQILEGEYRLTEEGQVRYDITKKQNGALSQQLKMQFKQYAIYYAVSAVIQGIVESISSCVNYAVDLDTAMTNIRMVTMDTKDATEDLLKAYNQMGQDLGADTLDIAEGAVDWLRQGYDTADAQELVRASTILSRLALIDNAEATEYLTSALKGYKLEAQDAMGIIDQMTSIDLKSATSASDLAEAMSRTANMARTTGFEMNELLGVIATVSEVTQNSASTIGNSVKTILSRMSNVKAGLDDFEGEALNDVEKTLNRVGIALRDNQGNWYDFYNVLDEVASRWDEFSDIQKSQITTALGGTRQRENVLVALENWDLVKEYAETGANSAGTAMEKYGIVLESVETKQAQLTAKVQEFQSNILNGGMIAGLIDVGKAFMDIINWGDGLIGKLGLLTIGTVAWLGALKLIKGTHFGGLIAKFFTVAGAEGVATAGAKALNVALTALKTHPIIFALSALIAVVQIGVAVFNALNVTLEEQHEKAQQAQADYEEVANELKEVNSELATTQQRIAELEGKDALTFVEQEELKKLKETNAELESQAYWLRQANEEKKKEVDKEAKEAWDKDFGQTGEFRSRLQTEYGVTGYDDNGNATYGYVGKQITEEQNIQEQIQYLGELKAKIQEVENAEGEWANKTEEQREAELERLRQVKTGVEQYLTEVGTKIQTDFLDSYDVSDDVKKSWLELQNVIREAIDPDYTVKKFEEAVEGLPDSIKDNLKDVDKAGNFKSLEEAFTIDGKVDSTNLEKFKNALKALNIEADDPTVLNYLNSLLEATDNINVNPVKSYATIIGEVEKKAKAVADAEKEMADSGYMSADTVATLGEHFADLDQYLTVTANGYLISKAGLDALNGSMLTSYQVALEEAKVGALNVLDQEHKKGLSYESTTEAILKQLNAQLALARVASSTAQADYTALGIGGGGLKDYQPYQQALANEQVLEDAIANLENQQTNYNKAKQVLNNITTKGYNGKGGSSGSSSGSKKEWWETALSDLKDDLDHNVITMDTYINGIQNILGKLKKGSDAWNEVNAELQKAKLDNVENQFDRGEITVDQYIKKLEELRKSYKKNTEGYKELTKTINNAKYDKFANQYERGEITASQYISKLKSLQNQYKKGSEEYKKLADEIDEIELEKTEKFLDKLQGKLDKLDQKIDEMGEVNTDKESVKYAQLLSQKYVQVQKNIASIQKELKNTNLTEEQREALQEELNELLVEEVDIRDEIEEQVRTYYENQKEQAEQQAELTKKQTLYNKEVELYGKQGKELFEYYTNKEIEALEAKKEALNENNEREQLENDILEARLKLQNALNNKTTKILTKQNDGTWQYEFSANMADVAEAQDELAEAEKALAEYDLQSQIDELNKNMENLANQYEDAEFWAEREYEQTMNAIEKTYGDIDALVEKWMNEYGDSTTELTTSYQSLVVANNKLEQSLVNLTTAIESKYETVGTNKVSSKDGVKSFDTGGKIVGSGLILAHDKERVLTEQQNIYFEQLISKLPTLMKAMDITKFNGYTGLSMNSLKNNLDKNVQTIISKVECVFPNITTTDGLQQAILELPRLALQKI